MAHEPRPIERPRAPLLKAHHLWYAALTVISIAAGISLLFAEPMIIFGVAGVAIMTIMLVRNPFLGALAYVIFEYARVSAMFPALQSLQLGKLIVLATLITFVTRYAIARDIKIVSDKVYMLFLTWLGIALVSMTSAMDMQIAFDAIIDLAKLFVICCLLINLVDTLPKWQLFTWTYLLLNFKLAQFQIRSFASGLASASDQSWYIQEGVGAGSGGFFANGNDFGLAMVVVVPVAFYMALSVKSPILKVVAAVFTTGFVVALLRSGSRGAALGLAAAAALYWARSRNKLVSFIVVVAFALSFWAIASEPWKERFLSAWNYDEDPTAVSRITLWKGGIAMFVDHPLTGVGLYNSPTAWTAKYNVGGVGGATACHNIFLQAASELGIGGLAVLIGLVVLIFQRNRETRRICREANLTEPWLTNFSLALDCSLLGFVVHGFFLTVLYYPHLYILTAMTISLHNVARKQVSSGLPAWGIPVS